ncbi:MAG: peptidoglycan-binding domain-containing protein, partial [Rhodoplanes sp.]
RDDVRRAQKLLGFSEEEQDGILGAITEEAIKSFQRRHGLPVTGDLDESTWDKLEPGRSRGAGALESGRGTGAGLLRRAREHIGEK